MRYTMVVTLIAIGLACLIAGCGPVVNPAATAAPPQPTATQSIAAPAPNPTATPVAAPTATTLPPTPNLRVFQYEDFKQEVGPVVQGFMNANHVTACSLTVAYPNASGALQTPILNYGTLSKAAKTPVDATTEYEIGSLTKLFTADLLAVFVREGKMKLDDPLQAYLPSSVHVPVFNGQPITLRSLATHTSGLPRKPDTLPEFRIVNGVMVWGFVSAAEMGNALDKVKLTSAPGEQWLYSNFAFGLLAMAEEKAGNASYETLVENKVIAPLGLRDTLITLSAAQKARLAQGESAEGDAIAATATSGESLGAGALRSTLQDLARYLAENLDPKTTTLSEALQLTQQRQARGGNANSATGLGWNIAAPGTLRESYSKDGSTDGYDAYIAFSRPNRTGFAVACNGHNLSKALVPSIAKLVGEFDAPIDDTEP